MNQYLVVGIVFLVVIALLATNKKLVETLKNIYKIEELRKRIVRFSYRKTDGTIREAIGTLKPGVLTMLSASSKSKPRSQGNRGCVVYFDLDREDWRCFCPENFITIHP